jgi:hypothetical protein
MAMINGTYEISSTGTAMAFFKAIKEAITAYTDWTVTTGDELELNCTTSVTGAKVHIYDTGGTSSSKNSGSSQVCFDYVLTSSAGTVTNSTKIYYCYSIYSSTSATSRKIYMHVYEDKNKGIYYVEFTNYKQTIPLFIASSTDYTNTNFGLFSTTKIKNESASQVVVAGFSCYDPNDYTQTAGTVPQPIVNYANGVVMMNYLVVRNSYITERFDSVYNCSYLRANYNWSINGKKYFTPNSYTLFEL